MSLSPSSSGGQAHAKRRRTGSISVNTNGHSNRLPEVNSPLEAGGPNSSMPQAPPQHIPKRGARACTACRKGKNRCEGEPPCRRCQINGTQCVFEKPEKKPVQALSTQSVERLSRLEGQYLVMQSQMIGMQSSLDRILSAVQSPPQPVLPPPQTLYTPGPPRDMPFPTQPPPHGAMEGYNHDSSRRHFPPLPGFAAPPHKYATYGIVPSTAPSSDDESEETLPRSALNAPIEALQGLANAAVEAANAPISSPRVRKRKKVEPIPRNAFPHVVEKGLVSDSEARELYHIFFSGCHLFIPLFDASYDTYEGLMERTPWTFDAILAVAAKIRGGNGPLSATFYKCLDEAQGIARSSLFGPVVRKEAVQGMLLLAAWSTNGWLPSGHAMRMALDLGLHRALEKLADDSDSGKVRSEEEERDLGKYGIPVWSIATQSFPVVSARIWLCLYWFDHQMSLGTGRPIVLRDESSIRHCRILLSHPMASPTDVRLISQVELVAQKTQIYDTLSPSSGPVNHNTLAFIRRANTALDKWYNDCDELHRQTLDEDSLLRKILTGELHYAKLWLVCVALRGVSWDKMPFEQRELAFAAKDAASNCLSNLLNSPTYRAALRYAVHDSLVTAAFSALFLLKMAHLFPAESDLSTITLQVEQLAQLLNDVAAERYAMTLRIMLANLRRKMGLSAGRSTPIGNMQMQTNESMMMHQQYIGPHGNLMAPFTTEELGDTWPADWGTISPSVIPTWLQEQSLNDLGLPVNGSDGIFLQLRNPNGWSGNFPEIPEAW